MENPGWQLSENIQRYYFSPELHAFDPEKQRRQNNSPSDNVPKEKKIVSDAHLQRTLQTHNNIIRPTAI